MTRSPSHDRQRSAAGFDPEFPTVQRQLLVFARELGELYHLERQRSEDLERALQSLKETYLATMTSLAQVVEAKDLTTRGHLDRTRAFGVALARRIDPALAEGPELDYGFFLHDIGKVGIPERILCKAGPLSADEWEVMRTHPTIGAQIVAPIKFLGSAVDVIRHHHERFDGHGYPGGLRGDRIPLAARIFAVADSYDAMTSDRPYRDALRTDRALDEIRLGAGKQFDPDVASVFIDLVEEDACPVPAAPQGVARSS
ncbi:MAG TPA: HD domain-containing phosphohydrolase [Actinomycetota bacterium]|nr:HD domain-containing phosphohydrolase [Actinomycetota bacterium]